MVIVELIDRALLLPLFTGLAKSSPFWNSISLSMKFRKQFLVSLFHNNPVKLKRDKVVERTLKVARLNTKVKVVRHFSIVVTRVVWFPILL